MDAYHWVYRRALDDAVQLSENVSIKTNKELFDFSEAHVSKKVGNIDFEYHFIELVDNFLEANNSKLKLVEKNSNLPIKTGNQKTLHHLEAICSVKFEDGTLTSSCFYDHNTFDTWKLA